MNVGKSSSPATSLACCPESSFCDAAGISQSSLPFSFSRTPKYMEEDLAYISSSKGAVGNKLI